MQGTRLGHDRIEVPVGSGAMGTVHRAVVADPSCPFPRALAATAVVLVVLAWSGSVFRGGFALDDEAATLGNPVVTGALPWTAAFDRDYWHHRGDAGHYRPLATLSLRMDHALWGARPLGYHVTNVLLHAAVVLLLGLLLFSFKGGGAWIALGLALFATHPVLADSVAWISGRTSMLSALGGLLALLAVRHLDRAAGLALGVGAALLLGLLGKEDAVVFVLPALLLALWRGKRVLAATAAGLALAVGLWLALRAMALGAALPSAPWAPLAATPFLERLSFAGRSLLEAARLVAWPVGYSPTYRAAAGFVPSAPPGALALLGWVPWLALVLGGGLVVKRALARRQRRRVLVGASAALAALALLPVLQIVPAGEVFAPRFLYLPLLFAAPALGALLARVPRPVVVLVLAGAVVLAWTRAGVYADRASYNQAVLAHVPEDVGAWNDLGLAREETGDLDGAAEAWGRATRLRPGYSRAWSNLGRLALRLGRRDEAESDFRRAVAAGPANAIAHCNLGSVLLGRGRAEEAARLYVEATRLAPGMSAAWRGLGRAYLDLHRDDLARAALARALALDPSDVRARRLRTRLPPR